MPLTWANFLHFYQPPTQKPHWVKRITGESYRRIVRGLLEHREAKLTLNINAVLVELLMENDGKDVVDGIRELLKRGQIELTGSAKFHPLLPRIPKSEIVRQIELNNATHKRYFGEHYKPRGFFPPEMAFSIDVAKIVAEQGFEWIIVDELSFPQGKQYPRDQVYTVEGLGNFAIFPRERTMSYKILSGQLGSGNLLVHSLGDRLQKSEYLLTAMDGETFGHHRPGMEHLLFEIYESKELATAKISDLLTMFPKREPMTPLPSTWALMEKDLERSAPFSRWFDPGNEIHALQWELTELAIEVVNDSEDTDPAFAKARTMLDRAIHSDQYWWASAKPWWSLEMIERGALELKDTVLASPAAGPEEKARAEELYKRILYTGFDWQRSGKVEELAHEEDEEVRQHTDQGIPKLPRSEVDKITANLKKEMLAIAEKQEYERAAQLRDRITELQSYVVEDDNV
jgi:hypothetical protein